MRYLLHTDGSATRPEKSGELVDGGCAFLLTDVSKQKRIRLAFQYVPATTINRMELLAVISGLRYASQISHLSGITIFTDSQYVKNAYDFNLLQNWEYVGWITQAGTPVKNKDLWLELRQALSVFEKQKIPVTFKKVKSHTGDVCNEYVDKLANKARKEKKSGYAQINAV